MSDQPETSWQRRKRESAEQEYQAKRDRENRENDDARAEKWKSVHGNIETLLNQIKAEQEQSGRREKKKITLDVLTVLLLLITAVLTGLTYWVFYEQLGVSRVAIKIAHDDAGEALKGAHQDAKDALIGAHGDSATALESAQKQSASTLSKADTANDISRTSLRAVQRAFVLVSGFRQIQVPDKTGKPVGVEVIPIIKNTGNTPASDVTYLTINPRNEGTLALPVPADLRIGPLGSRYPAVRLETPADPEEILDQKMNSGSDAIVSNIYVAPQTEVPVDPYNAGIEINQQSFGDIENGRLGSFLYGIIYYVDIFGTEHVSKYCFGVNHMESVAGVMLAQPPMCKHWNCLDADCAKDKRGYEADIAAIRRQFPGGKLPDGPPQPAQQNRRAN